MTWGEAVAGQYSLAIHRNNVVGKFLGVRSGAIYDSESVVGRHRKRIGQRHRLLIGMLLQRVARGGAISEKNVGASLCHMPSVGAASGRRLYARWSARELQGLSFENRARPRPQCLGFVEHLQCIVAGWIGFGRGGPKLDVEVEHSIQ